MKDIILRWFRTLNWFEFFIILFCVSLAVINLTKRDWVGFALNAITFGIIHAIVMRRMALEDEIDELLQKKEDKGQN